MPETKQGTSSTRRFAPPVKEEEEPLAPTVEEPVEIEPVVDMVPEPATSVRVKYVGGQGVELAYPLSNGQRSFIGGVVYELKNYGDFCRLIEASPNFVEVKDEPAR